jgi:hypothetical protein
MVMRCLPWILIAGSLLVGLVGCRSSTYRGAAQSEYRPPAESAEVARLIGTRRRPGFLAEDHVGYVLLVDRTFVPNPRRNWDQPLLLAPGRRIITAEYLNGPFSARVDIVLEARPGASYELKIANGVEGGEGRRFNDFWIVNSADGSVVTQVHHVLVSGSSGNYNPFQVN